MITDAKSSLPCLSQQREDQRRPKAKTCYKARHAHLSHNPLCHIYTLSKHHVSPMGSVSPSKTPHKPASADLTLLVGLNVCGSSKRLPEQYVSTSQSIQCSLLSSKGNSRMQSRPKMGGHIYEMISSKISTFVMNSVQLISNLSGAAA